MFRLPHIVVRFLKEIPAGFKLHLLAVNAGGVGGCFNQAERIIRGRGTLVGAYTLVTPSNYLPFGEAVQGDEQRTLLDEAEEQLATIASRIAGGKKERDPQSSWFQRALWPGAMYALGYKMIPRMADGFRVDESCTSCGICAKVCPVENIELVDGRPVWGSACEQCLACLNLCPASAIQHGKTSADQSRYRNPGVKVSELSAQKSL
jgi:ferredoxin